MPRPSAAEVDERLVAELGVQADHPLVGRDVDEVGLVQDDDRPDVPLLGGDQVAVDQRQLQPRLGQGRDDQELVDVRRDDVLLAAIPPRERPRAALDLLDQALVGPARPEPDAVARGHDVAAVDRQRLEDPPDAAAILLAVLALDDRDQPVHADDPPRLARRQVDGEHRRRIVGRGATPRPRPGSPGSPSDAATGPPCADPLARGGVGPLLVVLAVRPRQVVVPRPLLAVLPELDADFLLLRHGQSSRLTVRTSLSSIIEPGRRRVKPPDAWETSIRRRPRKSDWVKTTLTIGRYT